MKPQFIGNMTADDKVQGFQEEQEQKRLDFEAGQERKHQEFETRLETQKAKRDWMMMIITFAAVAAAYWTGYEARRARFEAERAAMESLKVQQKSVDSQIRTMQLEQRPYVSVAFKKMSRDRYLGLSIDVTATVSGRTAAVGLHIRSHCDREEISDFSNVPGPQIPAGESVRWSIYNSIYDRDYLVPGQSMEGGCSVDFERGASGPVRIIGVVYYSDLFQGTHKTPFCFVTYLPEKLRMGECLPAMVKNMPPLE